MTPSFSRVSRRRAFCGLVLAAVAALSILPASVRAQEREAARPGRYKNRHVDELEVIQPFRLADYRRIVIVPINAQGVEMPTDETVAPVKAVLAGITGPFIQGLQSRFDKERVSLGLEQGNTPTGAAGAGALVLRARLLKVNPGSRAARYFVGFGAGAAEVKVSGEVADGRTQRVLCRFTQERRSGVGMFGGDYVELLNRSLREIGDDVGQALTTFTGPVAAAPEAAPQNSPATRRPRGR